MSEHAWKVTETLVESDEPLPVGYLLAGEALPVRVTASMWVEAQGRTPDAALSGLHREVDRWHSDEGWELEDGKISVDHWDTAPDERDRYRASVVLTRSVAW